jgi:hypothetical protein
MMADHSCDILMETPMSLFAILPLSAFALLILVTWRKGRYRRRLVEARSWKNEMMDFDRF